MNEHQRLFLVQARTDFVVFDILRKQPLLPACHPLHYLQMATEKFGKALVWKTGPNTRTHRAFASFLRSLASNGQAQRQLGFEDKNEAWTSLIRSSIPLAKRVEDLAPALSQDGPNPEYPWPRANPQVAPAEHNFELWQEPRVTKGKQFLNFLRTLFASAEAFL